MVNGKKNRKKLLTIVAEKPLINRKLIKKRIAWVQLLFNGNSLIIPGICYLTVAELDCFISILGDRTYILNSSGGFWASNSLHSWVQWKKYLENIF